MCALTTCLLGADGKYKELEDHVFSRGVLGSHSPLYSKHSQFQWTYVSSDDAKAMRGSLTCLLNNILRMTEDLLAIRDAMECSSEDGKVHHKTSHAIHEALF